MDTQKHPRCLRKQCWAVNAQDEQGGKGQGQFLLVSQAELRLQWHLVQGVTNKGSTAFCGTGIWDFHVGERSWMELIQIWGLGGPEKGKKGSRFQDAMKKLHRISKASGCWMGNRRITGNSEVGRGTRKNKSNSELWWGTWLGIEPFSVLCHLCVSWPLWVQ